MYFNAFSAGIVVVFSLVFARRVIFFVNRSARPHGVFVMRFISKSMYFSVIFVVRVVVLSVVFARRVVFLTRRRHIVGVNGVETLM